MDELLMSRMALELGACTPVEAIIKSGSLNTEVVEKQSRKWAKWTESHSVSWPRQGSFDAKLLTQMEGKIMDFKCKDKSAKRQIKRLEELKILKEFMILSQKR